MRQPFYCQDVSLIEIHRTPGGWQPKKEDQFYMPMFQFSPKLGMTCNILKLIFERLSVL